MWRARVDGGASTDAIRANTRANRPAWTFITVSLPAGMLLCMVTGVEMREGKVSAAESKDALSDGIMLLDRATRGLATIPVGTIDAAGRFERGTDVLPTVNAPVFAVPPALVDQVYASYAEGDFAIGKLSLLPDQQAKINLDAFYPACCYSGANRRW